MIRDRRDEDLDRLCAVLAEVDGHAEVLAGRTPRDWLTEVDAELSWVFDQAPVTVTPTRNVVGHVQVARPPDVPWLRAVAAGLGRPVNELRVVGRLFVRPAKHDHGIARYLLTESVKHVESAGRVAVLDPADVALVPAALYARLGFRPVDGVDGLGAVLVRQA